ncbi:MAG: 2-oxo acid dehydrogenase subunit E2 [Acidimicrobiales bacterium]
MSAELVYAMPSMGADMEQGTVLEWLVSPGDAVHRGDVVARIDTEKAEVDAEIWMEGVVVALLAQPGEWLPVGAPLARIAAPDRTQQPTFSDATQPAAAPVTSPVLERPLTLAEPSHEAATFSPLVRHDAERLGVDLRRVHGSGVGGAVTRKDLLSSGLAPLPAAGEDCFVRASPYARRLADHAGVALRGLSGSGPAGAVLARDVPAAGESSAVEHANASTAPRPGREDRTVRIRRATAELMARSHREIPHYYLTLDVDLSALLSRLAERNAARPPAARLLPAAALLAATARAAAEAPALNGHWLADGFHPADGVDLGVAVSLRGGGLVAPVLAAAQAASLEELMERLRVLVQRARSNTLRSSDLAMPSVTVTNLGGATGARGTLGGAAGVDSVLPIIYPPQVAMVGFGQIRERPWAVEGMLTVRSVVTVSLAADHRASDGHVGARFLTTLATKLNDLATEKAPT